MLKLKSKLIFLVEEISYFLVDSSPFFLGVWEHPEDRLESLSVKFGLVVKILENESQLLTRWNSFDREMEPSSVPIFLVRSSIVCNPDPELISNAASSYSR